MWLVTREEGPDFKSQDWSQYKVIHPLTSSWSRKAASYCFVLYLLKLLDRLNKNGEINNTIQRTVVIKIKKGILCKNEDKGQTGVA
jgi:hypothetical protein